MPFYQNATKKFPPRFNGAQVSVNTNTVVEACTSITNWNADNTDTGAVVEANGYNNGAGTTQNCLKLVSASATAAQTTRSWGAVNQNWMTMTPFNLAMEIPIYIGDDEVAAGVQIIIETDNTTLSGAWTNKINTGVYTLDWPTHGSASTQKGWNVLRFFGNDWAYTSGRADHVRQIRILRQAGVGVTTTKIGPIMLYPITRPKVIFRFDDAYDTVYTNAFPVFKKYGFKFTVAMSQDNIGTAGYLSLSQLNEMHAYGADIIMHGKTHGMFPTLQAAGTFDAECKSCLAYWTEQGWTRNNENIMSIYPGGQIDDASEATLRANGYLLGLRSALSRTWGHRAALANPFRIQCTEIDNLGGTTPINVTTNIAGLRGMMAKGPFVVAIMHKVVSAYTGGSYEISTADFTTIVQDIARNDGLSWDVISLTDWYRYVLD